MKITTPLLHQIFSTGGSCQPLENALVWYLAGKAIFSLKFRTWLTILGVGVGTFALTAMGAMALHFHKMAVRFETYVGGKLFVREEAGFFGAGAIRERDLLTLADVKGIQNIIPILVARLETNELVIFGLPKIALGVPPGDVPPLFKDVPLLWGKWLQGPDECVLGANISEERKTDFPFFSYMGKKFKVSGIMARTNGQEDQEAILPLDSLENLLGRKGLVSYGIIIPDGTRNPESLSQSITSRYPHFQVLPPSFLSKAVRKSEILWDALTLGIGIIAALVGGIGILTVMMMGVQERIKEIAVTRALGASKSQIFLSFLAEAFILSSLGSLLGFAAGLFFVREANRFLQTQGMILFEPSIALIVFNFAAALFLSVIGGIYPAWYGARLEIARALRR